MANFDFRTYCNTSWVIFGTPKKTTKYGPVDPVFITKAFQKIQENPTNIIKNIMFTYHNMLEIHFSRLLTLPDFKSLNFVFTFLFQLVCQKQFASRAFSNKTEFYDGGILLNLE